MYELCEFNVSVKQVNAIENLDCHKNRLHKSLTRNFISNKHQYVNTNRLHIFVETSVRVGCFHNSKASITIKNINLEKG